MKKALILSLGLAFFVACSPDTETNVELESIDYTKVIDPDTAVAAAQFDNTNNGIYKGVLVAHDMSYHGVLTVNLANDTRYNAVLEFGDNERVGFVRINNGAANVSNVIEFRGENNAGFTLDVSDYRAPVITNAFIDGQGANIKLLKETSTNRVITVLGVYYDTLDPLFRGAWDLMSTSTRVIAMPTQLPLPFPQTADVTVMNITDVILTRGSSIFSELGTMEDFDPGLLCGFLAPTLPVGAQLPWFSGEQTVTLTPGITMGINEYALGDQSLTIILGDEDISFNLLYSKESGDKYYDINCIETPLGGTWSWKGRSGYIRLLE